ncbi:hypothetical protein L7F22_002264 [Adiantum nelumboides]|nr:hypothetical protein [Adiantum nelumboides]
MKKSDLRPVTVADFGVQSLLSMELGLLFPFTPLVAEEDASHLRLEAEERAKQHAVKPSLLNLVVEAVSRVASPGVQPVSIDSVLEAIDRGGEAFSLPSTRKMTSYWVGSCEVLQSYVMMSENICCLCSMIQRVLCFSCFESCLCMQSVSLSLIYRAVFFISNIWRLAIGFVSSSESF